MEGSRVSLYLFARLVRKAPFVSRTISTTRVCVLKELSVTPLAPQMLTTHLPLPPVASSVLKALTAREKA